MRKTVWALMGVAALMAGGPQAADAAVTCKIVRDWCPKAENRLEKERKRDGDDTRPISVPEPAMIVLLGAGVAAVGAARLRRRKKGNDQ